MSARDRRAMIDRSSMLSGQSDNVSNLSEADAAFYGAVGKIDQQNGSIKRTQFGAFRITAKGLELTGDPNQNDWQELGKYLFFVEAAIQWLIGDWLVYGQDVAWGDATLLAEQFERNPHTFHNYMSVCRTVDISRRRDDLSFGHHEAVAKLSPDEQVQALAHAAKTGMGVADFRRWLRGEPDRPSLPSASPAVDKSLKFIYRVKLAVNRAQPYERKQVAASLRALADELDAE